MPAACRPTPSFILRSVPLPCISHCVLCCSIITVHLLALTYPRCFILLANIETVTHKTPRFGCWALWSLSAVRGGAVRVRQPYPPHGISELIGAHGTHPIQQRCKAPSSDEKGGREHAVACCCPCGRAPQLPGHAIGPRWLPVGVLAATRIYAHTHTASTYMLSAAHLHRWAVQSNRQHRKKSF